MNSRILKKLSKRALKKKDIFKHLELAESPDPVSIHRADRKSKERWLGKVNKHGYIKLFDNTPCMGCTDGYYEPEWSDEPAYHYLTNYYFDLNTEYNEHGCSYVGVKRHRSKPSVIFKFFGI